MTIQPITSNNQPGSLSSLNQPITNSQSTSEPLNVLNQPITSSQSASESSNVLNQPITSSQSTSEPLNVLNQPITEDPSAINDNEFEWIPGRRDSSVVHNYENDDFIVNSMKQDLNTSTSDGRPAEYLDLDQLSRDPCRPPPIYKRLIFQTKKKKLKEPIDRPGLYTTESRNPDQP